MSSIAHFGLCLVLGTCVIAYGDAMAVIHVSPHGDDAAHGTADNPLASIPGARNKVRTILAAGKMIGNIEVRFKAGDYMMDAPVTFGPGDSGKDGHKVIHRSAGGPAMARLLGGRMLTGWEKVDEKVWKLSLPDNVTGCHLKKSGRSAIMMVGQNTGNLVYGCWIEQMGVNGITLSNWSEPVMEKSGNAARITHNVISNNKIHDVGQLSIYWAGIDTYSASQNRISHNEIFRSPRYALTMRGSAVPKSFSDQTPTPTARNRPPSAGNPFESLKIKNSRSKPLRSNRPQNATSAQTENVSWKEPFSAERMQYGKIGLKPDFPAAFGGGGEPLQRPKLPSPDTLGSARYRFDKNYNDSNGFSQTIQGGDPEFSSGIKREGTACLRLDGEGDLVTLPAAIDGDFTVSLWAKYEPQTAGDSLWRPLAYSGQEFDKGAIVISAKRAGEADPGALTPGVDSYETFDVGFDDGDWHFLTLVKSGRTWRAYHDGRCLGEGRINTFAPDGMSLQVGGDGDNPSFKRYFKGYIDDVRIWDDAMDDAVVAKLHGQYPPAPKAAPPEIEPMHNIAKTAVRPAGAPEYSDVCFRYGWVREEFPTVEDAKKATKQHKPGFTIAGNNGGFMGTRYVESYAFDFHYSDNNYEPLLNASTLTPRSENHPHLS